MKKTILKTVSFLAICFLLPNLCQAEEMSRLVKNLKAGKKQTIVTYGTSLTGGAGGSWVWQLRKELYLGLPGEAHIINSGKGSMWSKWGVDNLDERVIRKNPDVVFVEFAINDAYLPYKTSVEQAQKNLENMIERILKSNSECEIILMVMNPPIGVNLEKRPKIKDYYQMYRDVAEARKILLIDHYPAWENILNEDPNLFNKYIPDGIHTNNFGCQAVITPNILKSLGLTSETEEKRQTVMHYNMSSVVGRYVRIELPGEDRILSLAEVKVFANGKNIAVEKKATQCDLSVFEAPACLAVDGNTDGDFSHHSVTHTNRGKDRWWQVDLGDTFKIEKIVIWNRTDRCWDELDNFTIRILDENNKEIWSKKGCKHSFIITFF